ncbi:MAG: oligosaccharide flippase family protein, partial [Acidiferrobacterales bacterium]|nr:oligosaccharide flippase family protein [Acidiferrobacterales bacterium]
MVNVTEQHDRPVGNGSSGSEGRQTGDQADGNLLLATIKRVAHTSSWLLAFRVSSMLHGLVFAIFISRHLGPEKFGVLSYAISLAALAAPLSSLGLRELVVGEFKLRSYDASRILGSIVALRICGAVVATLIVFAFASVYPVNHPDIAILCAILAGAALFNTLDSIVAYFIAIERPRPYVVRTLVNLAIFSVVKVYLILYDYSVDAFILANAAQLVCHGGALWLAYRSSRKGKALFSVDFRLFWAYLRYSLPLFV